MFRQVYSPVTISNGLAWTQDSKTMCTPSSSHFDGSCYNSCLCLCTDYIDSAQRSVVRFDYSLSTGALSAAPSKAVSVPAAMGWPDGMCIDAEGMVWVAQWDGACVNRWNPQTVGDVMVLWWGMRFAHLCCVLCCSVWRRVLCCVPSSSPPLASRAVALVAPLSATYTSPQRHGR